MNWRKLGRIYNRLGAANGHNPTPPCRSQTIDPMIFRIIYTSRDAQNRSHVGWFEIDLGDPMSILDEIYTTLGTGKPGAFDMDGVMASALISRGDEKRLYYIGWNRAVGIPFRNSIGLAVQSEIPTASRDTQTGLSSTEVRPTLILWRATMSLLKAIAGTFGTYPGSTGCRVIHRNRLTICAMRSARTALIGIARGPWPLISSIRMKSRSLALCPPDPDKWRMCIATEEVISLIGLAMRNQKMPFAGDV